MSKIFICFHLIFIFGGAISKICFPSSQNDWVSYGDESCLRVYTGITVNYKTARNLCQSLHNGTLVKFDSDQEKVDLQTIAFKTNDLTSFWYHDCPSLNDTSDSLCPVLSRNSTETMKNCNEELSFICQVSAFEKEEDEIRWDLKKLYNKVEELGIEVNKMEETLSGYKLIDTRIAKKLKKLVNELKYEIYQEDNDFAELGSNRVLKRDLEPNFAPSNGEHEDENVDFAGIESSDGTLSDPDPDDSLSPELMTKEFLEMCKKELKGVQEQLRMALGELHDTLRITSLKIDPASGVIDADEDEEIYFSCQASGVPVPEIVMERECGDEKMNNEESIDKRNAKIPERVVIGSNLGKMNLKGIAKYDCTYYCTAYNGIGRPVMKSMKLNTMAKPHVKAINRSIESASRQLTLKCNDVKAKQLVGKPTEKRSIEKEWKWTLNDEELPQDLLDNAIIRSDQFSSSLEMENVDLIKHRGIYKCEARNQIGAHSDSIRFNMDPPKNIDYKAILTSPDTYFFNFSCTSPTKITKVELQYKDGPIWKDMDVTGANHEHAEIQAKDTGDHMVQILNGFEVHFEQPDTMTKIRVKIHNANGFGEKVWLARTAAIMKTNSPTHLIKTGELRHLTVSEKELQGNRIVSSKIVAANSQNSIRVKIIRMHIPTHRGDRSKDCHEQNTVVIQDVEAGMDYYLCENNKPSDGTVFWNMGSDINIMYLKHPGHTDDGSVDLLLEVEAVPNSSNEDKRFRRDYFQYPRRDIKPRAFRY